jgi:hypothetical protein
MDPSYQNLLDPSQLLYTLVAYLIHGGAMTFHVAFAAFLIFSGVHGWLRGDSVGRWARRLGATPLSRLHAAVRVALGIGLFGPVAVGAHVSVSALCAGAGLIALAISERTPQGAPIRAGHWARRGAFACGVAALAFLAWEREDNLALGAELIVNAASWRNEELDWQLATDPRAPKVGELAPDFELQNPDGQVQIRLSDFRGKRPVALVFGSYT